MLTRKEVVLQKPFIDRRYIDHRKKVKSALPRIDSAPPARYDHLNVKMKKLRLEQERQAKICHDNIRLVHKMAIIMRTKRMDDINASPKGPFESKCQDQPKAVKSAKCSGKTETSERDNHVKTTECDTKTKCHYEKSQKIIIQHRAPHGFCSIPQLKNTNRSPCLKEVEKIYGIKPKLAKQVKKRKKKRSNSPSRHIAPSSNVASKKNNPLYLDKLPAETKNSNVKHNAPLTVGSIAHEHTQSEKECSDTEDKEIMLRLIPTDPQNYSSDDEILEFRNAIMENQVRNESKTKVYSEELQQEMELMKSQKFKPEVTVVNESDEEFYQ